MIQVTRLNRQPFLVNSELIKFVENAPDTVITLVNGEKIVVLDAADVIVARIVEYRRRLLDGLLFGGTSSASGTLGVQQGQGESRTRCSDKSEE